MTRKAIQIEPVDAGDEIQVIALCDDGTIWVSSSDKGWRRLTGIPQI